MEERQQAPLIRPYVVEAEKRQSTPSPEQPGNPHEGTHRWAPGDINASGGPVPAAATRRPEPTASAAYGEIPPVKAPGASPAGSVVASGPAGRTSWKRHWIIAASTVVTVVAGILVVALTKDSTARPEARPAGADIVAGWLPSGLPDDDPSLPGPAAQLPEGTGPPFEPLDNIQTVDSVTPGSSRPRGSTASQPPKKPATSTPKSPVENATAYSVIEAEKFDEQNGIKTEPAQVGSGVHIGFITSGDWVRYDNIGFTATPARKLLISAANFAAEKRTGEVEVRLDSRSNAPIGSMTIPNNGDWFTFTTYSMTIQPTTGVHTVYLTFTSNQTEEYANIDWFRFGH
ncbi:hypothetical protein GCM10010112_32700 [Actinoplanes lobatus]|uniref:CBM6 domain-containing protein n=1 Tax=Actinoplanes lobatus TaxID=113568 RepID=A0ABQ4A9E1_9ACTN|nr:hypothetical protein GCM10010112_32700 [Actinoplanes lobatus]GIE37109.1 hypothetical protein Alo02nite_00070 [Actinoplanes lobatus]